MPTIPSFDYERALRSDLRPAEWQLLAALRADPADDAEMRAASPAAWRATSEVALRTHTATLLRDRLRRRPIPLPVPPEVRARLDRVYAWNAVRNADLLSERDHAIAILDRVSVPVLVLKSAHLASVLYEGVGARSMSDVDLLVPLDQLQVALDAMLADGYGPRERPPIAETVRRHRHLPYLRRPGRLPVELHWTLSEGRGATWGPERLGVWDRAERLGVGAARVMAPLDAVSYTCRHLAVHDGFGTTNGLSALVDLAAMLSRWDIDADALARRAGEWGIRRGVHLCLLLARVLLRAPVPDGLLGSLAPDGVDVELARTAVRSLLRPNPLRDLVRSRRPTLVPPPSASGVLGSDRWKGFARYVRAAAFPERDDLRLDRPGVPELVAWPRHWARTAWTHAGVLMWPLRRAEIEAERSRRRALRSWLAPELPRDPPR